MCMPVCVWVFFFAYTFWENDDDKMVDVDIQKKQILVWSIWCLVYFSICFLFLQIFTCCLDVVDIILYYFSCFFILQYSIWLVVVFFFEFCFKLELLKILFFFSFEKRMFIDIDVDYYYHSIFSTFCLQLLLLLIIILKYVIWFEQREDKNRMAIFDDVTNKWWW